MTWSNNGFVSKIESMGTLDGPGVRTVVFFGGCPLRCSYCHNPDFWKVDTDDKITVDELYNKVERFTPFHGENGGVTVSGGEPLSQPAFLRSFFAKCKENGIHTTLDTSGFGNAKNFKDVLEVTDLVIFDLKEPDPFEYPKLTGVVKRVSDEFVAAVQENNNPMWIRTVIVPGKNDTFEKMDEIAREVNKLKNVLKVQLLPYHTMGTSKYKDLGLEYQLEGVPAMSKDKINELYAYLQSKLDIYQNI
ncbi:MAG: pyruvate formate lyase-activating protein [Erysipelothrix sp.]|nr:pyruvate formate lyase-activating protein [Erysipelothrix sp.]